MKRYRTSLLAILATSVLCFGLWHTAQAQQYYTFSANGQYLANSSGTLSTPPTIDMTTCLWELDADGHLSNRGYYLNVNSACGDGCIKAEMTASTVWSVDETSATAGALRLVLRNGGCSTSPVCALTIDGVEMAPTAYTNRWVLMYADASTSPATYYFGIDSRKQNSSNIRTTQSFNYHDCVLLSTPRDDGGFTFVDLNGLTLCQYRTEPFQFYTASATINTIYSSLKIDDWDLHRWQYNPSDDCDERCLWFNPAYNVNSDLYGWTVLNYRGSNLNTHNAKPAAQRKLIYNIAPYGDEQLLTPEIVGVSYVNSFGAYSLSLSSSNLYQPQLYRMIGANNAVYYVADGGTPTPNTPPAPISDGVDFTWTFDDGTTDDGHVRILLDGTIEYYEGYDVTTTRNIIVTATYTSGTLQAVSAPYPITFALLEESNPTAISATDLLLEEGSMFSNYNYTLTAAAGYRPHRHVVVRSISDPLVASFSNGPSSYTITALAAGSATVIIDAYDMDNETVVCSTSFTVRVGLPQTGIAAGVVLLNDLEDNTWTYYSDPNSPIHALNPINVHITYYGHGPVLTDAYNETTLTALTSLNEATAAPLRCTSGVHVGYDAPEHTFEYYKTLERSDRGAVTLRAPYRTIANPFAVRPTYGTVPTSGADTWTGWRGFFGWRIKKLSGGAIYDAPLAGNSYSEGDIIAANKQVYLNNTAQHLVNQIDINIELEAVWAQAYLITTSSGNSLSSQLNSVADMERNFIVVQSAIAPQTYNKRSYAATYSSLFPNGTTDGTTTPTALSTAAYITNDNTVETGIKMEYIHTAGGKNFYGCFTDLVVGRRVESLTPNATNNTRYTFYQISGANGNSPLSQKADFSTRIESGHYYIARTMLTSENLGYRLYTSHSIWGSDYDRATANNDLLITDAGCGGGQDLRCSDINEIYEISNDHVIKSGTYAKWQSERANTSRCEFVFYLGKWMKSDYPYVGLRRLVVEGGIIGGIGGGVDYDGDYPKNDYISLNNKNDLLRVDIRIRGGEFTREVYCGSENSPAAGARRLVITGGTFYSWIAAGANANESTVNRGCVRGATNVYFGGDAYLCNKGNAVFNADGTRWNLNGNTAGSTSNDNPNNSIGYHAATGCLFGAGVGTGTPSETNVAGMVTKSCVVVADKALIDGSVYGGGNKGYCEQSTDVRIFGNCNIKGDVFGGSNENNGGRVDIMQYEGVVEGNIYGGSNAKGDVAGPVHVTVKGGTVGTETGEATTGNVFGGGYGSATHVNGEIHVTIGDPQHPSPHMDNPIIWQSVYGGGCNAETPTGGEMLLETYNGIIKNSVFGGGKGKTATVNRDTNVKIRGTSTIMKNVYGGGNQAPVQGNTNVTVGE